MDGTLAEEAQAPLDHRVGRLSPDQPRHRRQGINQLVADGVLYKRRGVGMFVATGAMSCLRGPALCPDARRTGHRRLGCRPALRSGFLDRGQSSSASLDLRGADACPAPIWMPIGVVYKRFGSVGLYALTIGAILGFGGLGVLITWQDSWAGVWRVVHRPVHGWAPRRIAAAARSALRRSRLPRNSPSRPVSR